MRVLLSMSASHCDWTSSSCARVSERLHSGAHVNIRPHPTPDAHVDEYECDFAGGWPLVSCVSAQVSEIASAQVSACPEYICSFYKATNVAGFALCFGGNFWSPH